MRRHTTSKRSPNCCFVLYPCEGHGTTLVITGAGFTAIGVEPVTPQPDPAKPKPRAGTKQALLIEMLKASDGATIAEITKATNWLPHTVRGAMSGNLKKRLGLSITSEKVEGRGRTYKIVS
jgi:uncharacterized protein DUF3489